MEITQKICDDLMELLNPSPGTFMGGIITGIVNRVEEAMYERDYPPSKARQCGNEIWADQISEELPEYFHPNVAKLMVIATRRALEANDDRFYIIPDLMDEELEGNDLIDYNNLIAGYNWPEDYDKNTETKPA